MEIAMNYSELEVEHLKQENARLHHLTNVLILHLARSNDRGLPLKDIDTQMAAYDQAYKKSNG